MDKTKPHCCPRYNSHLLYKYGKDKFGNQKYQCRVCKHQFAPDTPKKDKLAIFASLVYLVFPIDLLDAKRLPIIGWLDEVVSVAVMIQKMSKHITPDIEARVTIQLDRWFPEYAEYEFIEG